MCRRDSLLLLIKRQEEPRVKIPSFHPRKLMLLVFDLSFGGIAFSNKKEPGVQIQLFHLEPNAPTKTPCIYVQLFALDLDV
jgi:hypothetical protein